MKIHPVVSSAIAAPATIKTPPAQAAREALATQPDLAALPFGKLVSAFSRDLPLPSVTAPESTPAPQSSSVTEETSPASEPDPLQVS